MTQVRLDPASQMANTGAVTGGSFPGIMSDSNDGTYVIFDSGEYFQVTLSDLTLPAGGVVRWVQGYVRCGKLIFAEGGSVVMLIDANGKQSNYGTSVTWDEATTILASSLGQPPSIHAAELSDGNVDALTMIIANWGPGDTFVSEAYALVSYWVKPTVVVPDFGAITTDDTPELSWVSTYDSEITGNVYFRVKIFSSAQYGAGGFDPAVTVPLQDSGELIGTTPGPGGGGVADDVWTPASLPNDSYRVYVSVADVPVPMPDSGEPVLRWSTQDFGTLTINVGRPSDPTFVASGDNANSRVTLTATKGAGGAETATHATFDKRVPGGSVWTPVRGGEIVPYSGSTAVLHDYEGANGETWDYRARSVHDFGNGTYSRSVGVNYAAAWTNNNWVLKHPYDPDLNFHPRIRSQPDRRQPANKTSHRVAGRRNTVNISDVRGGWEGDLTIRSDTDAEREQLNVIMADNTALLLQAPPDTPNWPDTWISLGDLTQTRVVDTDVTPWTFDSFPWTEADRPSDD